MEKNYDYLIVGTGLAGSVFAYTATKSGKSCIAVDRRDHIGGNCYQENVEGIAVHKYGAHIFRTNNDEVWKFVNQFVHFNNFINSPLACYAGRCYNLPFNMNTFRQLWGVNFPFQAKAEINRQRLVLDREAKNLEEHALSLVGEDIYKMFIRGYTEKQWGKPCSELLPDIMRRIPVRYTADNNYYNAKYQGIPIEGYNKLIELLLNGTDVALNTSFEEAKEKYKAKKIVYTGALDELYGYEYGELPWRSLRFDQMTVDIDNYQGVAVVNYTESRIPHTRVIEHKHFVFDTESPKTVLTIEYPDTWERGKEPFYSVNNAESEALYQKYRSRAEKDGLIVCGRLGDYRYYDMSETIESVLALSTRCLYGENS